MANIIVHLKLERISSLRAMRFISLPQLYHFEHVLSRFSRLVTSAEAGGKYGLVLLFNGWCLV